MLPRIVCSVGILCLNLWGFLENLFLRFFPGLTKTAVREFCKIDTANNGLIKVENEQFYAQVALKGLLGFSNSIARGWVKVENMEMVIRNCIGDKDAHKTFAYRYNVFLNFLRHYVFYHPANFPKGSTYYYDLGKQLISFRMFN